MTRPPKRVLSGIALLISLTVVVTLAFLCAEYLLTHPGLQARIASFGYPGVALLSLVAGLNVLVPIPAATFVPVFTAAGLQLPFIVVALALGTVVADYVGHLFGRLGRASITARYPRLIRQLEHIYTNHNRLVIPTLFIYAAVVPVPNEAIVIPLAFLGMRWLHMLLPLLLGNLINQALYAYGFQYIYHLFF